MSRRTVRRITLWLILGLVILGCGTPTLVTSPPSVSSDPGSVETVVAQTAAAAQAQTLTAVPPTNTPTFTPVVTRTPTVSPTATATFLFLFPTETSLPAGVFDDNNGSSGGGGGSGDDDEDGYVKPTATASQWDCRVLSKSPANDAVIVGGTRFQAIWTVQNTGTSTWPKKGVDVVLESGARLQVGKPYYDIPNGVSPGGTLRISVTLEVPKRAKDYNTRWSLKVGRTNFCSVRFQFSVQ
jgi:hypothetical protein